MAPPPRQCFNSRSRVGSDGARYRGSARKRFQFTLPCRERHHSPARIPARSWFQFTLPCRERLASVDDVWATTEFQFTLPCRERRRGQIGEKVASSFNSRSRVGSDPERGPAPPNRARFNSRSRVGSDGPSRSRALPAQCFNSRSRVGSDPPKSASALPSPVSIHAPV